MTVERYDAYDPFAAAYDRHWGGFGEAVLPALDELTGGRLAAGARVLDLCCGTGRLAAALVARGCEVVGIDGSAAMIELARRNAPGAEFRVADARDFSVAAPVAVAVSTFDSLNHVMDLAGLAAVFGCVRRALLPGGRFVFDLNVEEGYLARWRGSFGIVRDDEVLVARASYDQEAKVGRTDLTMLVPDGDRWQRTDVPLTQRCHAEEDVADTLRAAGFGDVAATDGRDVGLTEVGRVFFRAAAPPAG